MFWKSFCSSIFKKDFIYDRNKLANWISIINKEFAQLTEDQINQLKLESFNILMDQINLSYIANKFDSKLSLSNEIE